MENEAAERETERKLAKAKANKVEEEETEEEEEEDEEELVDLVKCESMENLTKQVKRELELSDRLDKSLLRFLLHSIFIICILIILRRKIIVIICRTASATTRVPSSGTPSTTALTNSASTSLSGCWRGFRITVAKIDVMLFLMKEFLLVVEILFLSSKC